MAYKKNFITHTHTYMTPEGEVISQESDVYTKYDKEEDYVKLYYKSIILYGNVEGISIDFLLAICEYINYANADGKAAMLYLNTGIKATLCENLNIKLCMLNRYIKKCVDFGLLFETDKKLCYIVNPCLIAKGDWASIRKLRTYFDFVDGKWHMDKEFLNIQKDKQR